MHSLRNEKIGKLLWEFSLPAIIGMLVNALYNIISRIFVGQGIGYIAVAAVTVAFPIMTLLFAVAMLIGIGATALISIRLGEKRLDEVEKIAGNALTLLILLPLTLSLIYFAFSDPILMFFGAKNEVLPYAKDYISIIMLGSVFGSISFGLNNFIRAEGNPRIAMMTQIIGAVVNIILHYFFIFSFGWGIKGAAIATIISQVVSASWVLSHFLLGRSRIKLKISNLKPQFPIVLRTLSIGFAPFAMQIANSIQQTILNKNLMHYGGDLALAAAGIIMSVAMLLMMPIVGVSQGAQPIIGYNYGAGDLGRVKETLRKAIMVGTAIATTGYIILWLFAEPIVGLFSKNDIALTELTVPALLTFLALLPVVGFQIIGANFFQAIGKPVQSTILSLSRQVLLFIPLLLILPRYFGIQGVWITAPIADALAIMITASFLFYELRRKPKQAIPLKAK
ncbi:MAG: MATE family efflux transporter [Desulfitobacterium sp.]|nr:MATE family efflux transporter [Desulfitobacterium sp.]